MALTEDQIHVAAKALYDAEREVGMSSWWNAHPKLREQFEQRILAAQAPEAKADEVLTPEDTAYRLGTLVREAVEAQIKREQEEAMMLRAFVKGFLGQPPSDAAKIQWPIPNIATKLGSGSITVPGGTAGILINETDIPLQPDTRNTEVLEPEEGNPPAYDDELPL